MSKHIEKLQRQGIRWNTAMSVLTFLTQFIILYFLNKIIAPEDFGKAAFAVSALAIGLAFSNFSFVVVSVRQKNITQQQYNGIFYFALGVNLILWILFYFIIPNLGTEATNFSKPFLRAFSFVFLAFWIKIIPQIKLKKEMQFNKIGIINFCSKLFSLIGATYFAIKGYFFWALTFLYASLHIFNALLVMFSTPWSLKGKTDFSFVKRNIHLGASFSLHQLVTSLSNNIASIFIGNTYGQTPVAEYHKSFGYQSLPITHVASPIAQVMFPAFSKLQDSPEELSKSFLKAMNLTGFILLPVFFLLFSLAEPFSTLYFNENWNIERITTLLQIFSISGAVNMFGANFYSFFSVTSGAKEMNKIVVSQRVITILLVFFTFKLGIVSIAFGVLASAIISFIINSFFAKKYFYRNQLKSMLSIFLKTVLFAILSAIVGFCFYHYLPIIYTDVLHFALAVLISAISYLVVSNFLNQAGFTIFIETFLKKHG